MSVFEIMWYCIKLLKQKLIKILILVLKNGPMPKHIALIPDGNRRFSKSKNLPTHRGHELGANKIIDVFKWYKVLGVRVLTFYAFSTENFKRNPKEVTHLMGLIDYLVGVLVKKYSDYVCVRVIGDLRLLPENVRRNLCRYAVSTKSNTGVILNIAVAYTARKEIVDAIKNVSEGIQKGQLLVDDVDEDLLSRCMYTGLESEHELDVVIRTSGETRFSDFLLWQNKNALVVIVDSLWPQYSFWQFFQSILRYQKTYIKNNTSKIKEHQINCRKEAFLRSLYRLRAEYVEQFAQ